MRTGYGCNNRCRFCDQAGVRDALGDRPAEDVAADARAAGATGEIVVVAGGEATLRPELPDWVAAAREAGARRVVVQSNGRMLAYGAFTKRLVAAGCDVVAVALHGHSAALHDWLTRVDGSFEQAVAGIRRARKAGCAVLVNTVVTRSNFRHLPELVRLAARLGVRRVRFLWPRLSGAAAVDAKSLLASPELVAPYLWRAMDVASTLGPKTSFEGPDDFPVPERLHGVQRAS